MLPILVHFLFHAAKLRTVKLRQNSGELSSYFVAFDNAEVQSPKKVSLSRLPVKTTSIHVLPQRKFLVLDSIGDIHLLSLCKPVVSEAVDSTVNTVESSKDAYIVRLDCTMKVQMLAAYPDLSTSRLHLSSSSINDLIFIDRSL